MTARSAAEPVASLASLLAQRAEADARAAEAFGRTIVAMVTPFTAQGELDTTAAARLATALVDAGCDGLVLNGTTGESATTTEEEKERLVQAVVEAVGERARIIAGAGSNDTAHSVLLAKQAHRAGAHGLLVVTPYYNRPSQAGVIAHMTAVADATPLPVMLYDIPKRTGLALERETMIRLAAHPRIIANKDARDDSTFASDMIASTPLAWYSGDDINNLPLLAIGGTGVVSVVGHLVADRLAALTAHARAGQLHEATAIHLALTGLTIAIMTRMPGVVAVKAALRHRGLLGGGVRLPLVDADRTSTRKLLAECSAAGFTL